MIEVIHTGPFGVNTYIVTLGGSEVVIIDPACCKECNDQRKVSSYLKNNKFIPKAIVLTHGHFDHITGIKTLKEEFPDMPVLIHKEDSSMIGSEGEQFQRNLLFYMNYEHIIPAIENLPEADAYLEEGKTLGDYISSPEASDWKILHTPGHTKGCCCLYNQNANLLVSGDTLFYHSWGRTDLPGGSDKQMMSSLRRLKKEIPGNTLVYPGHDYFGFTMND